MKQKAADRKPSLIRKGPIATLSFFILLWLIGMNSGEPRRVLEQAIQICLSCIGIG